MQPSYYHSLIQKLSMAPYFPMNKIQAPFNSILVSPSSDVSLRVAPHGPTSVHPLYPTAQFPAPELSSCISRLSSKHCIYLKNPFHTISVSQDPKTFPRNVSKQNWRKSLFFAFCFYSIFSSYDILHYSYLGAILHT